MKSYLSTALALVCVALVVALILVKRGDNAQHETDAGSIADYSNRLDSAHLEIADCVGTMLTFSNNLVESRSAALTFSNHLTEAESTVALGTKQIAGLNRRVAELESENQTLGGRLADLTNQAAGLTGQLASTRATLDQANKDYALLENRFRIDVAERLVAERKFNNPSELQAQIGKLKQNPAGEISLQDIYAGLDVEVKANTFHVIAPN